MWGRAVVPRHQPRDSVKTMANGLHSQRRIVLSDGIALSRLPSLLAQCRQETIRLFKVPLSQQKDLYDVGFAQAVEVGEGIVAKAVWSYELMVAVPSRHPQLNHKRITLKEMLRYPLMLCDPTV
ncbi:hypothetical protein SOASR015_25220 [Pectobacterium carotovorum subsp. carotovorum]|nr:hypothetical protein SOASR015_25220 [Pectobacterium carotovorum subsp. carotovorum]GLX55334.1 hypothetical protein Pcaca02_06430 [Pectobacterium carotovorum subsp. carotovorum]